jgi:hypothetical protein
MELPIFQSIIHGSLRPNFEIKLDEYSSFSHLLNEIPDTLKEIEKRLKIVVGENLQLNFDDEQSINISQYISNPTFTPIPQYYFEPEIDLSKELTHNPINRFYTFVIQSEVKRIKLQSLGNAGIIKDDQITKSEIKNVLSGLQRFAKNIKDHPCQNIILDFLLQQIIKLYFELTLIFDLLLSEKDYTSFVDFYSLRLNRQPEEDEISAYQKAELIHKGQKLVMNFDYKVSVDLLNELYCTTPDTKINTVICALENAIFLHNNKQEIPKFSEIIKPEKTDEIIKEYKNIYRQRYEVEALALNRANSIDEIISEVSVNNPFKLNDSRAIAFCLLEYLKKQKEIYLKDPSAIFNVVTEKSALNLRKKPLPLNKPMQIKSKLKIAHRYLAFLSGINPKNDKKFMSDNDYLLLISYVEFLIKNEALPQITRKIPKSNIPKTWLRYTLYIIHKEIYSTIQDLWIEFMQVVFDDFSPEIVTFKTLKTKFSVYPSGYNQTNKVNEK